MHENNEGTAGALPVLRKDLECIPVRSDPRRVSVSPTIRTSSSRHYLK